MSAADVVAQAEARVRVGRGDLSKIRRDAKLSQAAIGRAVGVSRVTVCKWEAGTRLPSGEHAVRLAQVLRDLEAVGGGPD